MRIAFLAPAHPLRGGIVQFVAVLARRLQDAGHEVMIFSFRRQYPKLLFPGKDQLEPGSDPIQAPSVAVVTPYNPLTWPGGVNRIVAWNPDLVLFKYWIPFFAPCFGWMIRRIVKRTGCRSAAVADNIDFHEKWPQAERFTRYALGPTDALIAMSHAVEGAARKLFPGKRVEYLEHPDYDFFAFSPVTREEARAKFGLGDAPTLLFFGYIKPYKGLDLLLEAMPSILREIPAAKLVVAGEVYGDDSVYTGLIARHGLGKSVLWHGRFIANDETAGYFRAADLAVLPYRSATQSGVTKAAFAFDLPVVATDVGGLGEVIHSGVNGYLTTPGDPAALAAAVVRYFREQRGDAFRKAIHDQRRGDGWKPFADCLVGIARRK
jgi:D-inositol-3-phosphate glycosyltransferase